MKLPWLGCLRMDRGAVENFDTPEQACSQFMWGLFLLLVGWLHLIVFLACYYLTIVQDYHEPPGYLMAWFAELLAVGALYWICSRGSSNDTRLHSLERLIRRVWITYFILAFNLASMNALRGHQLFEFFPAIASLASFAFMMMTFAVNWRFIGAVLVMFTSGLLMSAYFMHAYLIFALAWWLVLNAIGITLLLKHRLAQANLGAMGAKNRTRNTVSRLPVDGPIPSPGLGPTAAAPPQPGY